MTQTMTLNELLQVGPDATPGGKAQITKILHSFRRVHINTTEGKVPLLSLTLNHLELFIIVSRDSYNVWYLFPKNIEVQKEKDESWDVHKILLPRIGKLSIQTLQSFLWKQHIQLRQRRIVHGKFRRVP